mmetsp:Transcript_31580/g.57911  ORF Transcript_31580/g.57911 Transcript_31580/m.57911 type:complete len:744 (-) Transcript_31580:83-2314(-)
MPELMAEQQEVTTELASRSCTFAERLRRIGEDFDREARQSMDAAVESAQREARLLRDEVEWLQRQLEDEWQQGAMRLGLCTELKTRLAETQEAQQQEAKAREYWQNECAVFEERHSLLEAKLAAVMLTEEDARAGLPIPGGARASGSDAALAAAAIDSGNADAAGGGASSASAANPKALHEVNEEEEANEGDQLDVSDAAGVERYLQILDNDAFSAAVDRRLQRVSADGLHALLVAAAGRHSQGAGALLRRIVQLWVGRLMSRSGSLALRTAVQSGCTESLAALLALGGTSVLASAATGIEQPSGGVQDETSQTQCLLSLCVERGDAAMLALLLEHLRGARSGLGLASVRRALELANSRGNKDLTTALSAHLAVELSHRGNSQYRHGEFEAAITSYEEAIALSAVAPGSGAAGALAALDNGAASSSTSGEILGSGENLVRMRYNLARALHRVDRWAESREQCTLVLELQPGYVNAYALRAQAAMAALDWESAQADWERLAAVVSCSSQGVTADMLAGWERRQEECVRQLSLSHYEVLGLPRIASLEAVKKAYRDLARQWHPDKNQHKLQDHQERAQRRFRRIREAYEVLGEEASKREYDASLLLCEARPLSTGYHGTGSGSLFGLGSSSKASDGCANEEGSALPNSRDHASERPPKYNSSPPTAMGRRVSAGTIRISSSVDGAASDPDSAGGRATSQSAESPLSRWLPSFRTSKSTARETPVPPIHVNLFDAQFVNADARYST